MRTMEERDSWGGSRVTPEGVNFFPKENLCKLLFVRNLLSLSQVKVTFGLAPFVFVQFATACDHDHGGGKKSEPGSELNVPPIPG